MSFDEIDMKSYAGEIKDPAAAGQETNFYQQEAFSEEFPAHPELLKDLSPEAAIETPDESAQQPVSKQELNFQALREEVDRLKAERAAEKREHELQLDIFRANMAQQQSAPIPEKKMFDGMADDDVPSVADLRKEWDQREAMYQSRLEELQVAQQYPDYAEVINKYAIPLVKQKPHLAQGIQGATNKAMFAYELGKMAQQMQAQTQSQHAAQPNANAQRIVENARKPRSMAQAGGQTTLSQADYYASMSDSEFAKMAAKHMAQI